MCGSSSRATFPNAGVNPVYLLGLSVSAAGSAIVQILVIRMKMTVATALVWLAGTTYARTIG